MWKIHDLIHHMYMAGEKIDHRISSALIERWMVLIFAGNLISSIRNYSHVPRPKDP